MSEKHEDHSIARADGKTGDTAGGLIDLRGNERHNAAELNAQLAAFESALGRVRSGQTDTNKAFCDLLEETRRVAGDQDGRLAAAHDGIKDLRDDYRKLLHESQRLAAGVNILNANLDVLKMDTGKDLGSLREDQAAMGARAAATEQKAERIAADLETRIRVIDETIGTVESRLAEEVSRLQSETDDLQMQVAVVNGRTDVLEERGEDLEQRTDRLQEETARLAGESADLQMQVGVVNARTDVLEEHDEDLERRTEQLQEETARLAGESADLQMQVGVVNARTDVLEEHDEDLEQRTERLQQQTTDLAGENADQQMHLGVLGTRNDALEDRADTLEDGAERLGLRLGALGHAVSRNFKQAVAAFVLVAVVLVTLGVTGYDRWEGSRAADAALVAADRELRTSDVMLDREVSEHAAAALRERRQLAAQAGHTGELLAGQQDEIARQQAEIARQRAELARLQAEITGLREVADNNAGLVNALAAPRGLGRDNRIHRPDWLAAQDAAASVIAVTSSANRQDLYDLAHRWSNRFADASLAWLEKDVDGEVRYTLVYGPFDDTASAQRVSRMLPVTGTGQRPQVSRLGDLL